MKKFDYLIIGGGVAGTTAAESIRFLDKEASIAILTEEDSVLYSRVMLPKFLRDEVSFENIYLRKKEDYETNNIELLISKKVNRIDSSVKSVLLENGEELSFEKLLIASGGKVNKLEVSGGDLVGINYLRTDKDAERIKTQMKTAKKAAVVGSGFIGIEFAQSFAKFGIETTCIIREPYFWEPLLGENSGRLIGQILEKNDINLITNAVVTEFQGKGGLTGLRLHDGKEIKSDIAGIGIGIHLELSHLENSGVKLNKGVLTNDYLESQTKDVWAAGDIAEFYDVLFEKYHVVGNWSNAGVQGRLVGPNMVAGWGSEAREKLITTSTYTIALFANSLTFLGDIALDEGTEIVERGSVADGKIGRLHIKDEKIVGASLINLPADRAALTQLVKNKIKITSSRTQLGEPTFSLNSLLPGESSS